MVTSLENTSKCEVLRVSRARTQIPFTYVLNGTPLTETDHARYLGTHISKDLNLKWNKHIDIITAKANRSLGFLRRNLKVSSCSLREKAYMGFLRLQLEYGSTIWDPRPGVENNGAYKVEMVQRRAARWTLKRYHNTSSVTDMLENLGWRTLEQRRVDARLALLFKIYNGLIPVDARKYLRHPSRRSRHSHSYSFIPLSTSTSSYRLSFYPRTITQWNSLPQSFFENTNLTEFKQYVSSFNHSSAN